MSKKLENAFQLFEGPSQGFCMQFANGVIVSIRWGEYNYSDLGKTTAEVAAIRDEDFICVPGYESQWEYDQVIGRLISDEVVKFMHAAANME
jgi:hypothetical protein